MAIKKTIRDDIHFKKLIENSYSGITLLDKNLKIFYRSPSAERIGGWNDIERANVTIEQVTHPSHQAMVSQLLADVLLSPGIPKTCIIQSKHYAGHYIWLECTYTNMLHEDGINAIVCDFHDITRQKESEILLKQTIGELSAYKYALDESAIVAVTDQKGIIQHVNDNFCKISKYNSEELIGHDHRIINSSHHSKNYIQNLWVTIANGKIWKGTLKNKAKDGTYYWVETTIVPFVNNQGKPYQYIAIRSDITERILNEERIAANERFLKTITGNLPAMITYWDADEQCLFANKMLLDWYNKTADEVKGIHKKKLMDAGEYANCEPYVRAVLKGAPQKFYRSFYKGDNQTIYAHTQYVPDIRDCVVKGFFSLVCDYTDIRKAEMKIVEKNSQIENLLENIPDGFIALDANLCCTYANKQILRIFGWGEVEMVGKSIGDIFPDGVRTPTWDAINTAFTEKIYVCNEDYYAPLNLWHENRVYPADGGLSIFIRNITQRKDEEKHLRLLESVITNTTDAVLITKVSPLDEPGPAVVYVNEAFTRMTGYSAEEMINKTPRILQGPKTDKIELQRLRVALQKGEPCEVTTVNYKKNGDEFWINFSVSAVKDGAGQSTHFIAIERDITQAKNEEEQKRKLTEEITVSLKEKNTILESIGDAFFAVDNNWTVTYWNNMAEKVLEIDRVNVLNKNLWAVFSSSVGSESFNKYQKAMVGAQNEHFEDFYPALNRWFEVSAYPSENGLSVYFKDITHRKEAESQLMVLNQNLQDQNEKIREISWIQSHVIRSPLARILGLIPLISEKYNDGEVMITYLQQSANELDDVIKSITDKSAQANYE
ncbi:PAS domain S-box protein [Mucilaginibacter gracilis]|uniref:PAS domain S-box protein n=1 Tax=Mucilaginibacter gracilis TaxID=423350 RepID=UPI001B86E758|nr:PAS domain S-box protein [Mucilaginibacter gracilis]